MTRRKRILWAAYSLAYDALWDNGCTAAAAAAVIAELDPSLPVEEVGAGTGLVTQHLVAAGLHVTASEPDPWMRRRFRSRLASTPLGNGGIEDLRDERSGPASVIAVNVVHLTQDPVAAIAELRRRATARGRVVVVTPCPSATLLSVGRAQRRIGVTRLHVMRFIALHVVLAPLTILAQGSKAPGRDAVALSAGADRTTTLDDASRLLVFSGDGS